MISVRTNALPVALLTCLLAVSARAAKTLDIYFIDVEGGQSTLIVSPSGQTLLVDTGYPGNSGRDAIRILQAAKRAGVKKIDSLLITHHHPDHVGGVENLLQRLPVTTYLDHGISIEDNEYPEAYKKAFALGQHMVVAPGDKIAIKGLQINVVGAAGKAISSKGEPNANCAGLGLHPENQPGETGENTQSAAITVQFGKFRFADLGDLTYNKQYQLLCPENKLGKFDLYLTTHHGGETLKGIWALVPRVSIMNNGARKGGSPDAWKIIQASPGLEDLWQLHFAVAGGKEANAADAFIANVDEADTGFYLKVSAEENGTFTVYNPRNKFTKTYAAK